LRTLLRVYGATLNFLQEESGPGKPSATAHKAEELFNKMKDCKILLGFRVMMYLTEQLFICSKSLQKKDITYEEALSIVEVSCPTPPQAHLPTALKCICLQ
jgi:hypothetical protein